MKNYEKCRWVKTIGQCGIYVTPNCKMAHMIRGVLCVTKKECEQCVHCKTRQGAIKNS